MMRQSFAKQAWNGYKITTIYAAVVGTIALVLQLWK